MITSTNFSSLPNVIAELCNLPLRKGVQCHASASYRFWYNASSSNCQAFAFEGCQGNSNNFLTIESCQHACDGVQAEVRCPRGESLKDGIASKRCSMHLNSNECPTNYECYFDGTAYGCCPTA
ncbi:Kunitz/Bovine pancreatic trypsin inhibitor domain protein, partial [Cooperia oncophora]